MHHMIRVDDDTYERLRKHVYELRLTYGEVVKILLDGYEAADPRTLEQRQLDQHAAEVLDTQESDRP